MPNGRPGDAPWSDFFGHGRHNMFPPDIAAMLLAIHAVDPALIKHLNHPDMWDWEQGKNLDGGREKLSQIMVENDIELQD
ncbi:MAG: hypothetical protein R3C28_18695 [Pirellulaceae bacterium]